MQRLLRVFLLILILGATALYFVYPRPSRDDTMLRALADEARGLMVSYPVVWGADPITIPKDSWPATIASLEPASVTVRSGMVEIATKSYFDGGWGYGFAPDKQSLTMLPECWSHLGHDVYWHGPC